MLRAERSELRRTNLSLRRTRCLKGKFNKEYAREYSNVGHAILYTKYDVVLESRKDFRATTVSLGMSLNIRSFWVNASTRLKARREPISFLTVGNLCPGSVLVTLVLPVSSFFLLPPSFASLPSFSRIFLVLTAITPMSRYQKV